MCDKKPHKLLKKRKTELLIHFANPLRAKGCNRQLVIPSASRVIGGDSLQPCRGRRTQWRRGSPACFPAQIASAKDQILFDDQKFKVKTTSVRAERPGTFPTTLDRGHTNGDTTYMQTINKQQIIWPPYSRLIDPLTKKATGMYLALGGHSGAQGRAQEALTHECGSHCVCFFCCL